MKRRKFLNYVNKIGGAAFVGLSPSLYQDNLLKKTSGEQDKIKSSSENLFEGTGRLNSKIIQYNGKPTLFVDEEPYFPMAFISYYPKQFRYKNMRDSGMRFFSLSITLGDRFVAAYRKGKVRLDKRGIWTGPGQINFDLFDKSINEILDVAPDAFIFPRIFCDSPEWWDSFHPAETSRTFDGLPLRQSFSSMVWRNETSEVLRKIVQHIYQSSYSNRIIGIHVAAGETEESVHHDWLGPVDYSLAAEKKFKEWLLHKYNNDKKGIEAIFNTKIENISIPKPEERRKAGFGDFYDTEKSLLVIDYNTFKCEVIVESIEFLCKTVKNESDGRMITGIFYGYTLVEWRDHLALSLMLKSPYIDFLSCTNGGGKRTKLGEHDMHFITETDSIHKANKLFYYEADTRTCMSKWISELNPDVDPYHEYDTEGWLGPETIEKSLELLKAVFSRVICTGSTNWWFDLWGGWYDNEEILSLFSKMQKIGDESIHLPRNSVSQVCLIVGEKSLLHYATDSRKTTWIGRQMAQIGKAGAPYDIYLLDDLKNFDVSKYRMFIFLNTFLLNVEQRQIITQKCKSGKRVLLWLYAPGMINDKISISNVSSLVNMDISSEEKRSDSQIHVELPGNTLTYNGTKVSPFLYIKKGADIVYGLTEDHYAVLGEKKEKDFSNVLACVPPIPWQTIQYFAKKAGVHIYCNDGEVVYANQSYLSISALKSGERIIKLPEKLRLKELLGSETELKPDKEHKIYFTAENCKFFRVYNK
jgi:glycosyl hydrolase family 42 (putative beta-galactosidase)